MAIQVQSTDKCPHCGIPNRFEYTRQKTNSGSPFIQDIHVLNGKSDKNRLLAFCTCTNCGEVIFTFDGQLIFPRASKRPTVPVEVPSKIAEDYTEACLVEPISLKAAAALGRRCLQNMLHDKGIFKANLSLEIDEAMKSLPSYLSNSIDAIRNIGNFATHPIKSTNTGEIVEIEEGETGWLIDTLESLFDFYYVQPAKVKLRRDTLDNKLKGAGKQPLK